MTKKEINSIVENLSDSSLFDIYGSYAIQENLDECYGMGYLDEYLKGLTAIEIISKLDSGFSLDDDYFWEDNFGDINSGSFQEFMEDYVDMCELIDHVYENQDKFKELLDNKA